MKKSILNMNKATFWLFGILLEQYMTECKIITLFNNVLLIISRANFWLIFHLKKDLVAHKLFSLETLHYKIFIFTHVSLFWILSVLFSILDNFTKFENCCCFACLCKRFRAEFYVFYFILTENVPRFVGSNKGLKLRYIFIVWIFIYKHGQNIWEKI